MLVQAMKFMIAVQASTQCLKYKIVVQAGAHNSYIIQAVTQTFMKVVQAITQ